MLANYKPSGWVAGHWEEHKSWRGYPYRVWSPAMPRIDDMLLSTVFYLYRSKQDASG